MDPAPGVPGVSKGAPGSTKDETIPGFSMAPIGSQLS